MRRGLRLRCCTGSSSRTTAGSTASRATANRTPSGRSTRRPASRPGSARRADAVAWDLTYDAATDTIYGVATVAGFNRLGTFDRTTGTFTPVAGGNGVAASQLASTTGIAFDPVRRRVVVYEYDGQLWQFTLDGTGSQLPTLTPGLGLNLAFDGSRFS